MRFFSEIIMAISITYVQSIWLALASLSSHSPSSSLALSGVSLAPSGALRGRSREEGGGRVHSSDPGRASLGPRSLCLLSSRSPVAAAGVGVRTLLFITRMHTHAHVQEPLSLHSTCPQAASRLRKSSVHISSVRRLSSFVQPRPGGADDNRGCAGRRRRARSLRARAPPSAPRDRCGARACPTPPADR